MANIVSNEKSHRADVKRHVANHAKLSAMKTQIKKTKAEGTEASYIAACSQIDRTLAHGVIHKNKARRLKSRLSKHINANA